MSCCWSCLCTRGAKSLEEQLALQQLCRLLLQLEPYRPLHGCAWSRQTLLRVFRCMLDSRCLCMQGTRLLAAHAVEFVALKQNLLMRGELL
jgi:hypothetical protein